MQDCDYEIGLDIKIRRVKDFIPEEEPVSTAYANITLVNSILTRSNLNVKDIVDINLERLNQYITDAIFRDIQK